MRFISRGAVVQALREPTAQRGDVGLLHRAEAAVAGPPQPGHKAPQPVCVIGPRQGWPPETSTHGNPRRLHSTHRLCVGMFGLRPDQQRRDHFEQLPLVHRAAAELEIDEHVGGDRRGRLQRAQQLRDGDKHAGRTRRCWPSCAGPECRPRSRRPRWRRGICSRGGRAGCGPLPRAWRCSPRRRRCRRAAAIRGGGLRENTAISTAPTRLSNSSSRFKSCSWQPSQLENLKTASFGLPEACDSKTFSTGMN